MEEQTAINQSIQEKIGTRLRTYRKAKQYSIEELAFRANMNPSHLGKVERGENNITLVTLSKILAALEISYRDFFDFDTPSEASLFSTESSLIEKTISCLQLLTPKDQKLICNLIFRLAEKK